MRIFTCICLIAFITSVSYSQDLKKIVQKKKNSMLVEEYFVLKSDKSVKNGNYVKYLERIPIDNYFEEFGSFDHNEKSGNWFYFSSIHPQNPLVITGEYKDGLRTGQWAYFYSSEIKDFDILNLLGFNKSTEIKLSKDAIQISIDTSGLKLAAIGNFDKDNKTGTWNYYSREGVLTKIYDFTSNKLVYNVNPDSVILNVDGGFSNFREQLSQRMLEDLIVLKGMPPSNAVLEIITNNSELYVNILTSAFGDPFSAYLKNTVINMSRFWIDFDPVFEKFTLMMSLKLNQKEKESVFDIESVSPKPDKNN